MLAWRYNSPSGRVGRRFVHALTAELTGVRQRRWNTERFIVFLTVTLQHVQHVTKSCEIRQRIDWKVDAWEEGEHRIMVQDTARTCTQYIYTSRGGGIPRSTG